MHPSRPQHPIEMPLHWHNRWSMNFPAKLSTWRIGRQLECSWLHSIPCAASMQYQRKQCCKCCKHYNCKAGRGPHGYEVARRIRRSFAFTLPAVFLRFLIRLLSSDNFLNLRSTNSVCGAGESTFRMSRNSVSTRGIVISSRLDEPANATSCSSVGPLSKFSSAYSNRYRPINQTKTNIYASLLMLINC